jgi:hypothetical protein
VLTFHTDDGIIQVLNLINGYLRSPKIQKFNLAIDYFNDKYKINLLKYSVNISDFSVDN